MSKDSKYEYSSPIDLEGDAAIFVIVPENILWTTEVNCHLISVFCYFYVKRGLDNTVSFSVNNIVNWLGKQPNRNKNGINNKIIECIEYLKSQDYLSLAKPLDNASINEATFHAEKVKTECNGHPFVILYLDELKKILNYKKPKNSTLHLGYETILMLFLYLKFGTFKRPNKLTVEEIGRGGGGWKDIENRRKESPEAFDAYYYQIAEDLELSSRAVSAATKILSELGLVYFEQLPKYKHGDEWRTDHTIFAFMYKREKGKLLESGSSYYEREVENKKQKIKRYRKFRTA